APAHPLSCVPPSRYPRRAVPSRCPAPPRNVEHTVDALHSRDRLSGRPAHELLSELNTAGRLPAGASAHVRAGAIRVVIDGRTVLSGFDSTVCQRYRTARVGQYGRGKTTLRRVLSGDVAPDEGRVERAGTVGVVRQSLALRDGETVGTLLAGAVRLPHLALRALDLATEGLENGDEDRSEERRGGNERT